MDWVSVHTLLQWFLPWCFFRQTQWTLAYHSQMNYMDYDCIFVLYLCTCMFIFPLFDLHDALGWISQRVKTSLFLTKNELHA